MSRGRNFWDQLALNTEIMDGTMPDQPIVEISGNRRVLIENHFGVKVYSRETIMVNVKFGAVCVNGCGLELLRMTKEQLVICGKISSVTLQRRDTK